MLPDGKLGIPPEWVAEFLGERLRHPTARQHVVLALRGRVARAHDWVSDPSLMPVFESLPGASFIVNGATPPQNSVLTSVGWELRFANHITLLASDFASGSSTYAGIRYSW
jgi:hypothetical protein